MCTMSSLSTLSLFSNSSVRIKVQSRPLASCCFCHSYIIVVRCKSSKLHKQPKQQCINIIIIRLAGGLPIGFHNATFLSERLQISPYLSDKDIIIDSEFYFLGRLQIERGLLHIFSGSRELQIILPQRYFSYSCFIPHSCHLHQHRQHRH